MKPKDRLAMSETDEGGRDPAVQVARRVFKAMEQAMAEILGGLVISPYDSRIRRWLEKALTKFEHAWPNATAVARSSFQPAHHLTGLSIFLTRAAF